MLSKGEFILSILLANIMLYHTMEIQRLILSL
jgi:hypothetical protein